VKDRLRERASDPGPWASLALGINNFDQVVCNVTDSAINPLRAFIGSPRDEEDDED
jgi:hypothetical protein